MNGTHCDLVRDLQFDSERELCVGHRLQRPKLAAFEEDKEGELTLDKIKNGSRPPVEFGFKVFAQSSCLLKFYMVVSVGQLSR